MSDDLIQRLSIDFRMLRTYDDPMGPFVRYYDHAQALTEARAEIERLTKRLDLLAVGFSVPDGGRYLADWQTRISKFKAAESELSTLRARVRAVVGPFAAVVLPWGDIGSGMIDAKSVRAARQLMEEVK